MYLNKLLNKFLNIYENNKENKTFLFTLYIASKFFLLAYKARILLYKLKLIKTYSLPAYIVCIGNITSGGTGKTPIAIEIAKYFLSKKSKVAVITRGYNAKLPRNDRVSLVSDGNDILIDPENCGEEAYLIAKSVPKALVLVGKDRVKASRAAIKLGAEVLILDDAFQYLRLNRNKDILMIDSYNPFDNGNLLPRGKLRELPDSISRASAIIISNTNSRKLSDYELNTIKKYAKSTPIGKINYRIHQLTALNTKKILSMNEAKGLKCLAFCGIGNPESFIDSLKRNEISILQYKIYPDHYLYEFTDIEKIIRLAKEYKIENIITTEKDAIKIDELCQAAPVTFWMTKLDVLWETPDFLTTLFNSTEGILNKL